MLQVLKMFACTEKKSKVFLERLSYKTIYGLGTVNSRECTASVFHLNTKAYGMVNERYPCFQSWKQKTTTKLLLLQNYYCSLNILETTTFYGVWIDLSRDQTSVSHLSLKACGMYNER